VTPVVVDTDVVSFIFKGHSIGLLYDADLAGRDLAISFMTLAELDHWSIKARWGEFRRRKFEQYRKQFGVIPYDRELCRIWAEVMCVAQSKGFRIECADAWIAATALQYDLPLATHNGDDYRGVPRLSLICHA
jgi:tRNA(fMet)-specific endonuclease VapC